MQQRRAKKASVLGSESQFAGVFAQAPVGMALATPGGGIIDANLAFLKMLGYNREEVVGRHSVEFTHSEDVAETRAFLQSLIEGQQDTGVLEKRYLRKDGEIVWARVSIGVRRDGERRAVQLIGVAEDITELKERRRAASQVREREREQWTTFDTALSYTPDSVFIFDLEGRFKYANQALLKVVGKSTNEVIGKTLPELNYPKMFSDALGAQLQRVIETKERLRDRVPFTDAKGETREFEHILVPIMSDSGEVSAVAGASRDITQQKHSEEWIEQDRRRWQELLLRAPAAIAIFRGPEHVFEWVNAEFVRLVGRQSDRELIGRSVREALPELSSQGYFEVLDGVYANGQPHAAQEAPVRLGRDDSVQERYVNFVCMPARDTLGRTEGNFVHATDVTALVNARKQIEESERQFRTLAETIPHLAWMAHADGQIFWYNQRWYDFTGTTLEQMEGWGWRKLHDPEMLPKVLDLWKLSLASGKSFDMVFPLRGGDGRYRTFLTRVEPVKDYAGRVVRWFGTNTDVTEQKDKEEELRRVNRDLEEFTYAASHDLQEPLRMVNIYTQLMVRAVGETDQNLSRYAGVVQQNVARMEALIQDLLEFSRTVHAEEKSPRAEADLAAALAEGITVLKSRIDESGARISVPESWPPVCGDTDQLSYVFQNLLSNALKYSKQGGPPEIGISATTDGAFCTISVQDNGIGFEPHHAQGIFGLFKRLHRRDEYTGTGIGLAICKRIVERGGGRIWAEGRSNEGATFHFTVPRLD